MAQQHTASADNKSQKQRPQPLELRTSIPERSIETRNNPLNLSPAELYISQQSQMIFDPVESPIGTSSIASSTASIGHAERMTEWREKQINNVYQHKPYRYKYGTPPSSTNHSTFRRDEGSVDSSNIPSSSMAQAKKK